MKKITGIGLKVSWLHTRFLILVVLGVLIPLFNANAQTITIGADISTARYPITSYYGFERSVSLFTSTELSNVGNISTLAWYANNAKTTLRPIKIYLKETTASTITATTWSNMISGATLVYDSSSSVAVGWNNFFLSNTFNFSGGSNNLLVLVETNYGGNGGGDGSSGTGVRYTTAASKHMYVEADNTAPTVNGTVNGNRPNIQITFGPLVTCFAPTNITTTNVTANTATISWVAAVPVAANGYVYEVRTDANPGTTGAVASGTVGAGVLSTPISSLQPITTYNVYVKSNCGGEMSSWSVLKSFTTTCAVEAAPTLLQPFTNFGDTAPTPACWSEATGEVSASSTLTGATSKWYGANFANTGSNEGARINLYSTNPGDWLVSQQINLGTVPNIYRIKYDMAVTPYNATTTQSTLGTHIVRVIISIDGGATWSNANVLKTYTGTGSYSNIGQSETINLVGYTGIVKIAFVATTSSTTPDIDFFIDNFVVEVIPSCLIPENVLIAPATVTKNSATISWTAPTTAPANGYEYEIRTAGDAGSGATGLVQQGITAAGVLSKDIISLIPSTTYSVYVRSVCAADNLSAWTVVKTFTTLCNYPDFTNVAPATICGLGTAQLSATTSADAIVQWFTSLTGTPVMTGAQFTTPEVSETTTFYVRTGAVLPNQTIQIGNGTSASTGAGESPLYYNWGGYKHQYIFTAQELLDAGLSAGSINSLGFDIVTGSTVNRNDFTIYMGETTQNAATSTHISGLSQVYSNLAQPMTVGISNYTFTTPFNWNGTSNIVVQINWSNNNSGNSSASGSLRYHTTSPSRCTYTYADNKTAAQILATMTGDVNGSGGTTTSGSRPNIYFNGNGLCASPKQPVVLTVTEAPEVILSSNEITICQGNDSELITITEGASEYDTYVWTPETGVSGNATDGWIINAQASGIYTLRASQSAGSLCKTDIEINVIVTQIGYEQLQEEYIVCKDIIQELSVEGTSDAEYILGTATTKTTTSDPETAFCNRWTYSKQQYIYTKAELNALGFTSGNIKGLAFNITSLGSAATNANYTVKMKQVAESSFANTTYAATDLTTVYGPITHTHTATGWQSINFVTPFMWDGTSNVLIELTHGGANSSNNAETYYTLTTADTGVVNQGNGTANQNPTVGTLTKKRLNIKFLVERELTTLWSPIANLYVDEAATQPYAGENIQTVYFKQSESGNYNVSATINNITNSCSATTTTIVKVPLVVLPVIENQVYCEPKVVEDLIFDRIDGYVYKWYANATSASMISTINTSGTYYLQATSNEGECKSSRVPVEIIIAQNLNPTVNASYTFCDQATFENIQVGTQYGAAVQWFATADSTTVLPANTQLSTTTYYVALAINDCVSERKPVSVTILQTPAPIVTQEFTVCFNTPLSQLSLGATNIKWYFNQTSTTALGVSAVAQSNTYYVTTFNGICESARIPVVVTVVDQLQMPTAATQNFCGSGTVSQLTATGAVSGAVYVWYNSATSTTPLQPAAALQNGTYYVSQKLTNCESPRRPVTVKVTSLTAPTATSFEFCGSATVADLSMSVISGITYNWYLPNQTTPLATTANLVTGNYLVSKAQNGCESTKTVVQVTIKPRPASPTGSLTQNFIDSAMISDLVMDQSNIIWYVTYEDALNGNNPLQTDMPLEDDHIYYGVLIGSNGCPSLPTAVTVTITLGVKDLDLASLKYYPNPVDSELTITYKEQIKLIEIYDLLGKQIKVQKFDSNDIRVNVSGLSSGTYMLRVQTNTGSQFIKIIKK